MPFITQLLLILAYLLVAARLFFSKANRDLTRRPLDIIMWGLASLLWLPYALVFASVLGVWYSHSLFHAHVSCHIKNLLLSLRDRISHFSH